MSNSIGPTVSDALQAVRTATQSRKTAAPEVIPVKAEPPAAGNDKVTLSQAAQQAQQLNQATPVPAEVAPVKADPAGLPVGQLQQPQTQPAVTPGSEPSGSLSQTVQRSENGFVREFVGTGAGGRSASRTATVSFDPETQTLTREVTRTGPQGNSVTRETNLTRTEDGYSHQTVVDGPNGSIAKRNVTMAYDAESQAMVREVSVARADGDAPAPMLGELS